MGDVAKQLGTGIEHSVEKVVEAILPSDKQLRSVEAHDALKNNDWLRLFGLVGSLVAASTSTGYYGAKVLIPLAEMKRKVKEVQDLKLLADANIADLDAKIQQLDQANRRELQDLIDGPLKSMQIGFYVFFGFLLILLVGVVYRFVLKRKYAEQVTEFHNAKVLAKLNQQTTQPSRWWEKMLGAGVFFGSGLPVAALFMAVGITMIGVATIKGSVEYESGVKSEIKKCVTSPQPIYICLSTKDIAKFQTSMNINIAGLCICAFAIVVPFIF